MEAQPRMDVPRVARSSDIAPRPTSARIEPVAPNAPYLRVAFDVLSQLPDPVLQAQPQADRYSSYLCAALSAWSYADGQALCDVAYRLGFGERGLTYPVHVHNGALFLDTDVFYLRSDDGRYGVLVFRGTELDELADFLTDIDVTQVPVPHGDGRVHRGFLNALMPVWDPIVRLVTDPETRAEQLLVTGHSLGGALAGLATLALTQWGHVRLPPLMPTLPHADAPMLRGLYTFGQPMIGDTALASWADQAIGELTHRFIYGADPIPRMPPRLSGRFAHFGRAYRVKDGAFAQVDDDGAQSPSALLELGLGVAGFVTRRMLPVSAPLSLDDHSPGHYAAVTRKAANAMLAFP